MSADFLGLPDAFAPVTVPLIGLPGRSWLGISPNSATPAMKRIAIRKASSRARVLIRRMASRSVWLKDVCVARGLLQLLVAHESDRADLGA